MIISRIKIGTLLLMLATDTSVSWSSFYDLDTIGEVTITGTTGQVTGGGGRIAVATGSATRGAGTFGTVVVTTRTTAR